MKFVDLSHTIIHGMPVFPGEKEPSITADLLPADAGYVTHRLETNMHTGTHIDAPFHVKSDTISIDQFPIDLFSGKAIMIDVKGQANIKMKPEWEELFKRYKIILFNTGHGLRWGENEYYDNYPEFDIEIAEKLVKNHVRIAGFDCPSPDKEPYGFHSVFLKNERFMIENLTNLDQLAGNEDFTFMSFPLKIEAEASLVRAVAVINQ